MAMTGRPRVSIAARGVDRVRRGHPWVYVSDVLKADSPSAGLVEVYGPKERRCGLALFSPRSNIALRMVATGAQDFGPADVARRVESGLRRRMAALGSVDAFRWLHGEADLLPGIFVDVYDGIAVVQASGAGAEAILPWVLASLEAARPLRAIVVRNDMKSRRHEKLSTETVVFRGPVPEEAVIREGALTYTIDVQGGQKTGSFLDQRDNHLRAAAYGHGVALDCFCYHGGFGLQLARVCQHVTFCDISRAALERCRSNALREGIDNASWVEADGPDYLRQLEQEGRRFDTVVLDPPSFASTRETVERAYGAYVDINRRAMRMLRPNGVLVTCSCSGRVSPERFDQALAEAASRAGRSMQVLERRGAGADHPVLLNVPETEYLKCRILTVVDS